MKLSIIIPTWNTAEITKKCLYSLKKFLPSAEIIVVDNGSTDNTGFLLSSLPWITYIHNTSNLGFAAACNLGAAAASGDIYLFLNSDMVVIDSSLLKMAHYLLRHPRIGIIGPRFLDPDHSPQASVFPPQTIINAYKEFFLHQSSFSKYSPSSIKSASVFAVSGGALMITASVFHRLKGWDERYFFYFEDLDLCRRSHHLHLSVYYYPKAVVIHYHGFSGRSLANSDNQWRRLIPSSIIYHGRIYHYLLNGLIWLSQQWSKISS